MMSIRQWSRLTAAAGIAAALAPLPLAAAPAPPAQAAAPAGPGAQPGAAPAWTQVSLHDGWGVVCAAAGSKECRVVQSQLIDNGGNRQRVLLVMAWRENGKTGMSLTVPLGIDLRGGLVMKIGEGAERQFPFVTCATDGCRSVVLIDEQTEKDLRTASVMRVRFRPFGSEKPAVVSSPLKGFDAALDALAAR